MTLQVWFLDLHGDWIGVWNMNQLRSPEALVSMGRRSLADFHPASDTGLAGFRITGQMSDNPLGPIQGASSQQFSINATDIKRVGRLLLIQIIGMVVTYFLQNGVPWLLGLHYQLFGQDITTYVLVAVNTFAELLRRFFTKPPKV